MEYLELRVHGVHGTSPGSMLGVADDEVVQVAGDDLTGVYRATTALPLRTLAGPGGVRVAVEAYSWGALTSGVRGVLGWVKRSLWLLLLPFALVNLAYWARLEVGEDSTRARLGARAVRVAGLLLTVFFVLTPCAVLLDLGAWQCFRYGVPSCERVPHWLDLLAAWSPSQRLALASLGPLAGVGLLFVLSRTSLQRYEAVAATGPTASSPLLLRHRHLWNGTARTQRLQRAHLAAGLATVACFLSWHLAVVATGVAGVLHGVVAVLAAVVLLGTVLVVAVAHEDDVEPPGDAGLEGHLTRTSDGVGPLVLPGAVTAVVLSLGVAVLVPGPVDQGAAWTARNGWFLLVFVGITLLHLVLLLGGRMRLGAATTAVGLLGAFLVACWALGSHGVVVGVAVAVLVLVWAAATAWHYRTRGVDGADLGATAWRGAGASVLLAAASWVALLFTSAVAVAAANWLNGSAHGVGDLVTTTKVETAQYAGTAAADLRATGAVVLDHARVRVGADGAVTVLSGTVRSGTLVQGAATPAAGDLVRRKGRLVVGDRTELLVPGRTVRLEYSCVGDRTGRCTAEDQTFRGDHVLTLAAREVAVDPGVVLDPASRPQTPLAVPQVLVWTPLAQLVWLVLAGLAVAGCLVLFARRTRGLVGFWSGTADDEIPVRDRDRALAARRSAVLAHRAERLLDVVGAVTSLVGLLLVGLSLSGQAPWQLPRLGWTRGVADAAMYLAVALSAGLVLLGSRIRRSESARKTVGVLWDLTTFWPRAAHPLAPPCYAERVVPELLTRVRWALATDPDTRVVLSGHSQGSLISVAVASRLTDAELRRVHLVTYGSQVRALYGRIFPAVVGPAAVGYVAATGPARLGSPFPDMAVDGTTPAPPPRPAPPGSLRERMETAGGGWINLFRRTDPLGWRVFSDADSDLDLPVPEVPVAAAGDPGPRVMTHGGYQHSTRYREVLAGWTGEDVVQLPTGTADVPPLPAP